MTSGNYLLVLGFISILLASLVLLRNVNLKYAKRLSILSMFCVCSATGLLISYQIKPNFRFSYVFEHISTELSLPYKISALWAGQEGSFLLWAMICTGVGFILGQDLKANFNDKNVRYVQGSYWLITALIIFMTILSKPFKLMSETKLQGLGLNDALQDPWMVVHPPLIFISYAAMAILFSMSLAGDSWLRENNKLFRKWTLISWIFLGAGIITGSMWAYRALGWGGYWAWDPIENAALIPWLLLTSNCHRVNDSLQRMRGMLPFVLAAFGTFLARSGILKGKSAHAYTEDALCLPLILFLILLVVIMYLVHRFGQKEKTQGQWYLAIFSCLNYACLILAGLVLLGTIMPIFTDINIGQNYFNTATLIFSIIVVALFVQRDCPRLLVKPAMLIITTVVVLLMSLTLKFDNFSWLMMLWITMLPMVSWINKSIESKTLLKAKKSTNFFAALIHVGVLLLILGTVTSAAFSEQGTQLIMSSNQKTVQLAGETVKLEAISTGKNLILHRLEHDLIIERVVAKSGADSPGIIYYTIKPLICLFWIGGCLMLIGGFGALISRRRGLQLREIRPMGARLKDCLSNPLYQKHQ